VFQLRQFASILYKGFKQEQEKKTIRILTKQLEDHLRELKLIPQLIKAPEKIAKHQQLYSSFYPGLLKPIGFLITPNSFIRD
jgi:hypothetical protein